MLRSICAGGRRHAGTPVPADTPLPAAPSGHSAPKAAPHGAEKAVKAVEKVAEKDRSFPSRWIADNRIDVTDEFVRYATPLIGEDWVSVPMVKGLPRFARITRAFAPKKLPAYIPQTNRKKG